MTRRQLVLESHCSSRFRRPGWAQHEGFTEATWLDAEGMPLDDAPGVGRTYALRASAPFLVVEGAPFLTLWLPAIVTANGWQPEDEPLLARVRVVTAVWSGEEAAPVGADPGSAGERPTGWLRATVVAVEDPLELGQRAVRRGTTLGGAALRHQHLPGLLLRGPWAPAVLAAGSAAGRMTRVSGRRGSPPRRARRPRP